MTPQALLRGGRVLMPDGTISVADILLDGGRILEVGAGIEAGDGANVTDVAGLTLAPGFIDVHVHGGGGFSLITRDAEEMRRYGRWAVSRGVTSFLATIVGNSVEHGLEAVRAAASAVGPIEGGATLLGLNLEGPFVSPERPGALPREWLRAPDLGLLERLMEAADGTLRVMTIAPELPGAFAVLRAARVAGVVMSVGHTDATYEQALAGFEAGAGHVTHAFNAMRPLHHRDPGPLGAASQVGATVEVIADGVHLHKATVRLLAKAFGVERTCLITDAVSPAGLDTGVFRIGGHEARLEDGSIRLPDGTIAGSAATMDAVVRNVVAWGAADVAGAIRMASAVPARVAGAADRKGAIAPGFDADIVALTDDLHVARTWVTGELVYEAPVL